MQNLKLWFYSQIHVYLGRIAFIFRSSNGVAVTSNQVLGEAGELLIHWFSVKEKIERERV